MREGRRLKSEGGKKQEHRHVVRGPIRWVALPALVALCLAASAPDGHLFRRLPAEPGRPGSTGRDDRRRAGSPCPVRAGRPGSAGRQRKRVEPSGAEAARQSATSAGSATHLIGPADYVAMLLLLAALALQAPPFTHSVLPCDTCPAPVLMAGWLSGSRRRTSGACASATGVSTAAPTPATAGGECRRRRRTLCFVLLTAVRAARFPIRRMQTLIRRLPRTRRAVALRRITPPRSTAAMRSRPGPSAGRSPPTA